MATGRLCLLIAFCTLVHPRELSSANQEQDVPSSDQSPGKQLLTHLWRIARELDEDLGQRVSLGIEKFREKRDSGNEDRGFGRDWRGEFRNLAEMWPPVRKNARIESNFGRFVHNIQKQLVDTFLSESFGEGDKYVDPSNETLSMLFSTLGLLDQKLQRHLDSMKMAKKAENGIVVVQHGKKQRRRM